MKLIFIVTSYNDITKNFFEAKRLTLQEPHKPVTAKKICVWERSNENTFPLEITHVSDDVCQREPARFKQSVTVHEKSKKSRKERPSLWPLTMKNRYACKF